MQMVFQNRVPSSLQDVWEAKQNTGSSGIGGVLAEESVKYLFQL